MDPSNNDLEEFDITSRNNYHAKLANADNKKNQSRNFTMNQLTGKEFHSDADVKVFIQKLEKLSDQNFSKRDDKTINDLVDGKRIPANTLISSIFIRYQCIHGPRRPTISTGMRKT